MGAPAMQAGVDRGEAAIYWPHGRGLPKGATRVRPAPVLPPVEEGNGVLRARGENDCAGMEDGLGEQRDPSRRMTAGCALSSRVRSVTGGSGMRSRPRSAPGGCDVPGPRSGRIDGDFDDGGLDGVNHPPLGEAGANLLPRDSARSPITGLALTEAQHVVAPASRDDRRQALHIPCPIVVVEDVEEPAVEHGVELLAQLR